ncbi:helix-turn-helix transcriptional regulator [Paraburkholderia hayleyella]|uniref:helix-turn-helix transcriptional regulator n=1 Tax=Paraburkholderia hayleyella TaxID=2152889 RepID=UPI001FEBD160|nr:helix-turn-helix transcriptional regulator [Paraburkholderia hayleyella]
MPIPSSVSLSAPAPTVSLALFTDSLRAAGTEMFCATLLSALNPVVALAHCTLVRVTGRHATIAATASLEAQSDVLRLTEAYVAGYFLQDPLVREHTALPYSSCGSVMVCSSPIDALANTDYLERFFTRPAIADKLSVIVPGPDAILFLNLYKSTQMGCFLAHEKTTITALGGFLGALIETHCRLMAQPAASYAEPELLRRWRTLLSEREKAVTWRLGCGATAKAVAAMLALAPSSVITYKKRSFAKLGIARQSELVALVALLGAAEPGQAELTACLAAASSQGKH